MKILTIGCSHSGDLVGDSWPVILSERFPQHTFIRAFSNGASNEFNLQKLIFILEKQAVDLVIFQLTEPGRLMLGLDDLNMPDGDLLTATNSMNGCGYYTFNSVNNVNNLRRITGNEYDDSLFIEQLIPSEFNIKQKMTHTMLAVKALCDVKGASLAFFSWYVPVVPSDLWKTTLIMPGVANRHLMKAGFKHTPCYHYERPAHEHLVDNHLIPFLLWGDLIPN